MSDTPKPLSTDEMLTLARQELATSLKVEVNDPKVVKAADTLAPVLKETLKGSAEKIGLEQKTVSELLTNVHHELEAGSSMDSIKQAIKLDALTNVAARNETATRDALGRAAVMDNAFGGKPESYKQAFQEASEHEGVKQEIKVLPESIDIAAGMTEKVKTDVAEGERLIKAVGQDKIDAMKPIANGFVDGPELKSAIELRSAHVKQAKAAAEITKDGAKLSEDMDKALKAANEAASNAEKAANGLFGKLRGANAAGDAQKAFDRVMQTAIDNSRETNPDLHAALKANLAAGKTELGDVGKALTKERFASAGLETAVGRELGAVEAAAGGMGKWGKYGLAAGAVAVAVGGARAAMSDDRATDPQSGEKTGEKSGITFKKVAGTALAILGTAAAVTALKGGNPAQGWKEGEGMGKFAKMVSSSFKTGAYAGR